MKLIRTILALPFFILSAFFAGLFMVISGEDDSINYKPKDNYKIQ